jgi:hypothetical protein
MTYQIQSIQHPISLRTDPLSAYTTPKTPLLSLARRVTAFAIEFLVGCRECLLGRGGMSDMQWYYVHVPMISAWLGLLLGFLWIEVPFLYLKSPVPSVRESLLLGAVMSVVSGILYAGLTGIRHPSDLFLKHPLDLLWLSYCGVLSSGIGTIYDIENDEMGAFCGAFGVAWYFLTRWSVDILLSSFFTLENEWGDLEKKQCQNFAKAVLTNHFVAHPDDKQQEKEDFEAFLKLDRLSRIIVHELLKCPTEPSEDNLPIPLGEMKIDSLKKPMHFLKNLKALRKEYQTLSDEQKNKLDLLEDAIAKEEKSLQKLEDPPKESSRLPKKEDAKKSSSEAPKKDEKLLKVWQEAKNLAGLLYSFQGGKISLFWGNFAEAAKTIS